MDRRDREVRTGGSATRPKAGTTRGRPDGHRPRFDPSPPDAPAGADRNPPPGASTFRTAGRIAGQTSPRIGAGNWIGAEAGDGADTIDLATAPSDRLGDEVVTLARHLATDTYALLRLVGEIDARGAYVLWGSLSCAAWLADACEMERSSAHRKVRVARAMRTWSLLDDAMADGDLSFAKARTIVPHLCDANVVALIGLARTTPVARLGAAVAAWLHRHDDPDETALRQHQERSVSWRTDPDGMVTITARLEPADAGAVCAVIDGQVRRAPTGATEPDGTRPSLAQQRADALVAVTTTWRRELPEVRAHGRGLEASAPDHGLGPAPDPDLHPDVDPAAGGPVSRVDTELIIHVTADGSRLTDGTPLGDHAVTRLLPDSFVSLLLHDAARRPIDASPRRRFPTRRQRRVVDARQDTCAEPGCSATQFLEYDHVEPYDPDHPNTVVDNLQRLCGPHNRAKSDRTGPDETGPVRGVR